MIHFGKLGNLCNSNIKNKPYPHFFANKADAEAFNIAA